MLNENEEFKSIDYTIEEIEEQIKPSLEIDPIIKELDNKPIIIVSHYCSYTRGNRYELVCWLEEICNKYNIPFINPAKELKNYSTEQLFIKEKVLSHYTPFGEQKIKEVYEKYLKTVLLS